MPFVAMARSAFDLFGPRALALSYSQMVALPDRHPEIVALNAGVEQKRLHEA